ncbi:MAG: peptide-methionine (S)-S-oxide reductase MsrA [Zetaproteobacteria bacterium]|nr:peptide-methionine (S)-S-oxide reductase MsrA [Zetaproteobacteria bacterium]
MKIMIWMVVMMMVTQAQAKTLEKATFAAGCFWCMEHPFDMLDGVISTTSGYTGGHQDHPTYAQVSSGQTGHAEAVQVLFDADIVSYRDLLAVYWRNSDPTTPNRQFCDVGSQYRPAIFYHSEAQHQAALASRAWVMKEKHFSQAIVTEIIPATHFWAAEDYHQDYYHKNPIRYKFYRYNCGRDQRLKELWGEP